MFKKGSKLYSILNKKCPKCHEANLFKNPTVFPLNEMAEIPKRCPVCNENFEPEPGFYWGAMYVNYGLSVAVALPTFLVLFVLFDMSMVNAVFIVIVILLINMPFVFRLGRSIWINLFVNYDPNKKKIAK